MSQGSSPLRDLLAPLRSQAFVLGPLLACVLLSYAYFVGAPAWNQNSRFALTRAFVERLSTDIDPHHHTTGDKSYRQGHFYSDKAPGVSLFSAAPYAGYLAVARVVGLERPKTAVQSLDPKARELGAILEPDDRLPGDRLAYNQAHRFALYLCSFFVVAIPTALLGAGAVFLLARHLGPSDRVARWVAVTYALGTPAWTYATALYGHQVCASLLIAAFAVVVLAPSDSGRRVPLAVGTLLGAAVITEYPAAIVVVGFVGLAGWRHGPRFATAVIVGGLPWAVILAAYHTVAFGGPLATGYDFVYREEFAQGMAVRYGLGAPDPSAALALLFGSFRGLFYLSPVLLLATWGLGATLRRPQTRWIAATSIAVFSYFWLLNAGYYMWDGGAAAGPRHMLPALPFLALGLGAAWTRAPGLTAVLSVVSGAQMLLLTAASPEVAQFGDPLWEFALGRLLDRTATVAAVHTNLGLLLGLPGPLSLLPLVAIWIWAWPRLRGATPDRASVDTDADPD